MRETAGLNSKTGGRDPVNCIAWCVVTVWAFALQWRAAEYRRGEAENVAGYEDYVGTLRRTLRTQPYEYVV